MTPLVARSRPIARLPPPPPLGRLRLPPPPPRRSRLELVGYAAVVVGYTALMLLLFAVVLPDPGTQAPWEQARTSASVARDYLPSAITALALLAVVAALGWWRQSGISSSPQLSPWGVVPTGVLIGFVVFFGSRVAGIGDPTFLLTLLTGSLIWAFNEELQLRGIVLYGLARRSNPWRAAWVTTLLFGLAHLSSLLTGWSLQHALAQVIAGTMDGAVFAKVRLATRSLWFSIVVHGLGNYVIFLWRFARPFGESPYTLMRVSGWIVGIVLLISYVIADVRITRISRSARRPTPAPPANSTRPR